jgi:peroxisomal 3,2-trans-enoyl-CoA isomerase
MLKDFTNAFLNLKKPIIACCQGGVIGFVFPLLSIFDQVYVTEDAYFFAPMLLFGQVNKIIKF